MRGREAALGIGILTGVVGCSQIDTNTRTVLAQEQPTHTTAEYTLIEQSSLPNSENIPAGECLPEQSEIVIPHEAAFLSSGATIFEKSSLSVKYDVPKSLGLGSATPVHTESRILKQPQIRNQLQLKVKSYH